MTNNKSSEFSSELQEFAIIANALSHPARLAIIKLLAEKKEIKTGTISDDLPIARPTVSRHLKVLKEAGIIQGTIDGLKIHYCLDMIVLDKHRKLFNDFFTASITNFLCNC
ncbi:MAG: metalloregulator ArsR/SmtB family transcription factor [Bacteroidetes bacterium]|nr:metalloregulator ArsR/SmtB family transcription factor [Bacteroidota bacterium]